MPWAAIIGAFVSALPSLVGGLSAFTAKHAELRSIALAKHQQSLVDDDAELARRAAQEATTARSRVVPVASESAPAVTSSVPAKSSPYGAE